MTPFDECKKYVEDWDAGHSVKMVVMGGLGPGYDQAIQMGVVELLRWLVAQGWPSTENYDEACRKIDNQISYIDKACGLGGFSGAQAAVIFSLVKVYWVEGIDKIWENVEKDRQKLASKYWPGGVKLQRDHDRMQQCLVDIASGKHGDGWARDVAKRCLQQREPEGWSDGK